MASCGGIMRRREWRKMFKKRRRKVIRQKKAQQHADKEAELEAQKLECPQYRSYLAEMEVQEQISAEREELERALRNAIWLENEEKAQVKFKKERQIAEAKEREEMEKKERIRREYEEAEHKLEEAKAERLKQQEQIRRLVHERHTKLQEFAATGVDDYLDELQQIHNTRLGAEDCKFFVKTGACRHGFRCSLNHPTPGLSRVLLVPGFFDHPAWARTVHTEYGYDGRLEFDEEDLLRSFEDFFRDIILEFELFGRIRHVFVCRNHVHHLKGSVYIEYESVRNAAAAYLRMNGRFYAKMQLRTEFRNPILWPTAVCALRIKHCVEQELWLLVMDTPCRIEFTGLFELKRCQKGSACNFLHIFKNPDNRYVYNHFHESRSIRKESTILSATPLIQRSWDEITSKGVQSTRNPAQWRWSESPEMETEASTSKNKQSTKAERQHGTTQRRSDSHRSRSSIRSSRHSRTRSRSRSRTHSRRRSGSRSGRLLSKHKHSPIHSGSVEHQKVRRHKRSHSRSSARIHGQNSGSTFKHTKDCDSERTLPKTRKETAIGRGNSSTKRDDGNPKKG